MRRPPRKLVVPFYCHCPRRALICRVTAVVTFTVFCLVGALFREHTWMQEEGHTCSAKATTVVTPQINARRGVWQ